MLNLLKNKIKDKKILILGFGREGKSTYKRLTEAGGFKSVSIADKNHIEYDLPSSVELIEGDSYQSVLDNYDIVFKSPGVVLQKPFEEYRTEITSQTEIFIEKYASQIIGITGTKGKSTTTTLIYHILKECGIDCVLTGNIGIPSFDVIDDIDQNTKIVFELSCHQLENISVSPEFSLFLNLFEEHLDHYGTFEKYAEAKRNIYKHQSEKGILICSSDLKPVPEEYKGKTFTISQKDKSADIFSDDNVFSFKSRTYTVPTENIKLVGKHNYYNIAAAAAACNIACGLPFKESLNAACTYSPLPHRLEFAGEYDGIKYYDDSISTICEAAIQAVTSLNNVDTIIIGGMDRGIDYSSLITFLSDCSLSNIILMSDSGKRIFEEIKEKYSDIRFLNKIYLTGKLDEAVRKAKEVTAKGKTCVLSPAAASYNDFKNFEERGDVFKKMISENNV